MKIIYKILVVCLVLFVGLELLVYMAPEDMGIQTKMKKGDCVKAETSEYGNLFFKVLDFDEESMSYIVSGKGEGRLFYFEENRVVPMEELDRFGKVLDLAKCEAMPKYLSP